MISKEQLQSVAVQCSQFDHVEGGSLRASSQSGLSCENCTHFTSAHECDLNLIEKILVKDVGEDL